MYAPALKIYALLFFDSEAWGYGRYSGFPPSFL